MADGALQLLQDPSRLAAFKAAAREKAVDRFDVEKIVPVYENYYRKIMAL